MSTYTQVDYEIFNKWNRVQATTSDESVAKMIAASRGMNYRKVERKHALNVSDR